MDKEPPSSMVESKSSNDLQLSVEVDLLRIERRETTLWLIALGLMAAYGALAFTSFFLLSRGADLGDRGRTFGLAGLVVVSVLALLFGAYVAHSRRSFAKVRRLFEKQALRDSLTRLLTRQSFRERVEQEMSRAGRDDSLMGLMLLDLDDFKGINDQFGHPQGDRVLKHVAKVVLGATRGSDLVFRWGGDEFLVILSPTVREGALQAARRIQDEVTRFSDASPFDVAVSIGMAFYPEHSREIDELIALADEALYIAKKSGDRVHVGREELPLDESVVSLVFQPVVGSRDRGVLGYEVLSRGANGDSVANLFRRYGAVGQLDELKRMIFHYQLSEAVRIGLERVFLNVDGAMLDAITPPPIPEGLEVILELAEEELVTSADRALSRIAVWRERGYEFAIDDFGASFVALPFVVQMIPSFIKMDRSTIEKAKASNRFSEFLREVVAAMQGYSNGGIIAEGIETEEELEIVARMGVENVQGHLLGKPKAWED